MPPYSQDSVLAQAAAAAATPSSSSSSTSRQQSSSSKTSNNNKTQSLSKPKASSSPLVERTVATGLANLGNTCYMNAVLQALAHCPELGMAMDLESHSTTCPIGSRAAKAEAAAASSTKGGRTSPSSLRERTGNGSSNHRLLPTRKSTRSRKSPSPSSNNGTTTTGATSAGATSDSTSTTTTTPFCVLCEVEYYLRQVHQRRHNNNNNNSATPSSNDQSSMIVAPTHFVHGFIDHVAPWFKLGVQEDSHEFLRLLMDAMQSSCIQARKSKDTATTTATTTSTTADDENTADNDKNTTDKKQTDNGDDKNVEYPFQLFRGTVESKVQCESCRACSSTIDPIEDIGLDVSSSSSTSHSSPYKTTSLYGKVTPPTTAASSSSSSHLADVSYAFSKFNAQEILDGYKCEKCGNVGKATKESRLHSIPPILTLHLKRFRYGTAASHDALLSSATSGGGGGGSATTTSSRGPRRSSEVSQLLASNSYYGSGNGHSRGDYHGGPSLSSSGKSGSAKIEGHVKFEQFFDLRPYLTLKLQETHKSMFCRLFCVVVHAGANSHSGHYIAYVRNVSKNEWWKMDDARVSRVGADEVLAAEAYMLFYRAVEHPTCASLRERHTQWIIEQRQLQKEEETTDEPTASSGTGPSPANSNKQASSSSLKRKREVIEFRSGEDWALEMLRMPPNAVLTFIRRAQEFIADQSDLTPDFFARVEEAAIKECGHPNTVSENEIQGGVTTQFSPSIMEMLFTICEAIGEQQCDFFDLAIAEHNKEQQHPAAAHSKNKPQPMLIAPPVADANEALL